MGVNGIYGLSGSGLDIESMVKVGMMSKQNEYDKMAQKYTKNEWTKTEFININNQITTFNMSTLSQYKMSANMNAKTAESSSDAIKATANAKAAVMSHSVQVTGLSSNAYLTSGKGVMADIIKTNGGDDDAVKNLQLKDILFSDLKRGSTNVTSNYGTVNASVTSGGVTLTNSNLLTSTALNISGDSITGGTYTGTGGTEKTLSDGTASINKTLKETETTSFTVGDYTLDATNVKTYETTTTNAITFELKNSDGSVLSPVETTTEGNKTTYKISDVLSISATKNDDGTTTVQSITTNNEPSPATSSTVNIIGTRSFYEKETETTTTFGDGTTLTTTETRDSNSAITKILTAEITTTETGITGTTAKSKDSSGNTVNSTNSISADFENGKKKTAGVNDIAIRFSISDGVTKDDNGNLKTVEISYTYAQILGLNDETAKTIRDMYSDINTKASSAGLNIRAAYDTLNDVFSLYNSKGGEENKIEIKALATNVDSSGNKISYNEEDNVAIDFFNRLGLKQFAGSELSTNALNISDLDSEGTIGSEEVKGKNGTIKVDGIEYETTDNKVTVGDVTYNALAETTGAATVSVTQDVDGIVDKVKSFVENYNKLLSTLYEKYDEKPDSNYKPLTQSQKDSMKDEQIEKWEAKAKQGLLYHDKTLSKIISDMRTAISTSVDGLGDGSKNSVYSIGISTTGIKGQLTLDETKLKQALSEDADSVYNVFAKLDTSAEAENGIVKENGIAQRLGDIFTSATKLIRNRAGSSEDITEDSDLNNLLRELQTKMSNFKKLMTAFEDRLYKKYDAMESTLAKLGMQLNFISGSTQ